MRALNKPLTKGGIVADIIRNYVHDYEAEGDAISKRRLWYILKPSFDKADLTHIFHKGKPVQAITNADYNKSFNDLAKNGEIDDTFISDNSRTMEVGRLLPNIVLAVEKSTVDTAVLRLANDLGISCYIAKGFSSIYAAKKLKAQISQTLDFEPYEITADILDNSNEWYETYSPEPQNTDMIVLNMTDYDKSGIEISDTIDDHFTADEAYRVLLTLDQVPEDKTDEYFDINADGSRAYELDILNIHQLRDIFLAAIPAHIANMIVDKRNRDHDLTLRDRLIPAAIDKDKRVIELQDIADEHQDTIDEIEKPYLEEIAKLEEEMEEAVQEPTFLKKKADNKTHEMKVNIFDDYVESYANTPALNFLPATVEDVAKGIDARYDINEEWKVIA